MASKKVYIDVVVDDKGTTQKVAISAKKLSAAMQQAGQSSEKLDKSQRRAYRTSQGTAQNTSNTTKAFAKQAQGLNGIVPIYATFAANVFAVSAAFGVLRRNAALQQLEQGLVAVGNASGTFLPSVAQDLKDITGAAISTEQALKATSLAVSAGFSGDQLKELTVVASGAAKALGRDVGDALDRLVRGTAKLEPEILDELGILVRLDSAAIKYAATIGKTANELTQFEKQQAFLNATIEQGQKKFADLNSSIDVNAYDQLSASFTEITRSGLDLIGTVLNPLVGFLASSPTALIGVLGTFGTTLLKQITPAIQDIISGRQLEASSLADKAKADSKSAKKEYKKASQEIRQFSYFPKGVSKFDEAIKNGTASIDQLKLKQEALNRTILKRDAIIAQGGLKNAEQSKARLRTLEQELVTTRRLIQLKQQQLGLTTAQSFATAKSAQALAAANTQGLIASSGAIGGFGAAIKGVIEQFSILGTSGAKGISKFRLGLSAAGKGVGFLGTAVSGLIGPISLLILAFSVLGPLFNKFFNKKTAEQKKLEALKETYKGLAESVSAYTLSLKSSESESDKYFKTLKFGTGIASGVKDDITSLAAAVTEEAQASRIAAQKEIELLQKEIENFVPSALSQSTATSKGVPLSAFATDTGTVELAQRKVAENDAKIAEQQKRIGKISAESAKEVLEQRIFLLQSSTELENQNRGLIQTLLEIKDNLKDGLVDPKTINDPIDQFVRLRRNVEQFSTSVENGLSNALTEQNKLLSKARTPFSGYVESLRASGVQIDGLVTSLKELEDAENSGVPSAEALRNVYSELSPEAKKFVDQLTLGKGLIDLSSEAVKSYLDSWEDIQSTLVGVSSKLGTIKAEQAQLSKIGLKTAEIAGKEIDLQNKIIAVKKEALDAEAVGRLRLAAQIQNEDERNAQIRSIGLEFSEKIAAAEASRVTPAERMAAINLADLNVQKQIFAQTQKQVQALSEQAQARESIAKAALEQANIDSRRQDLFADFGSRQAEGEAIRSLELEESLLGQKIETANQELKLTKQRIDLDFKLLKAQTKLALLQASAAGVEDLSAYDQLLTVAEKSRKDTIAAAESSTKAQIIAAEQVVRTAKDAVKEYEFIEVSLRGAATAFADGVKDGLVGLVRGTKTLKESLVDLANGILDSIVNTAAEAITNDLLNKVGLDPVSNSIDAGFMSGATTTKTAISDSMGTGATTVKGAIESGGDTTAMKIKDAFAQASVDYSVKCCNDSTGAGTIPTIQPVQGGTMQGSTQLPPEMGGLQFANASGGLPGTGIDAAAKAAGMTNPGGDLAPIGGGGEEKEKGGNTSAFEGLKVALMENTEETLLTTSAVTGLLAGVVKNTQASEFLSNVTKALQFATLAMKAATFIQSLFTKQDTGATKMNTAAVQQNTAAQRGGGGGGQGGFGGLASIASIIGMANGGVASGGFRAFANGGTVNKPTLGMVGEGRFNEAVVPLPDGKSIPVMMEQKGVGQQQNNVTVNVAVANDGSSATTDAQSDSRQAAELGKRISDAVQLEMRNQKRPGGILSPYGAA